MPRPPIESDEKIKWKKADRPALTTSTLPPELLKAIADTGKSNRAVEMEFEGDPIGARRILQRLIGLADRGYFDRVGIKSARRGGKLFVWLDSRPKGKPPDRTPEHSVALPHEDTPPFGPSHQADSTDVGEGANANPAEEPTHD
jgi:hypothetical protein